ncbi:MAG: DUF2924 domain-containing protein [Pseudomonadota bacterium]
MTLPVASNVEAAVSGLDGKPHGELKAQYKELTGDAPPKRIGRSLLTLAVAYEIQRAGHKHKVDRVHRKLAKIAKTRGYLKKRPRMKPGGRLVREWRGKTYEVYVAEDGVFLDGERFQSLSAVAFAITGAKWNGPRFFGLRSAKAET